MFWIVTSDLQVQGSGDTDSLGEVVERNMDLLQAFVKSLLMVRQTLTSCILLPKLLTCIAVI